MTNSYEIVAPQITAQEAQRRFRQGEFLKRNHHLISPWMYTPQQVEARNRALMLMHFDLAVERRPLVYRVISNPFGDDAPYGMKPLADGEIAIDEYRP